MLGKIIGHPLFLYLVFIFLLFAYCNNVAFAQPTEPICSVNLGAYCTAQGHPTAGKQCQVKQFLASCNYTDPVTSVRYSGQYGTCWDSCTCPEGQILNTIIDGNGRPVTSCIDDPNGEQPECEQGEAIHPTSGTCAPTYDDPFECAGGAAVGTAIQNSTGGYSCEVGDNYPCPAGTTPGTAFDGNGNSINTCTSDGGNSSSDSNSSGQNSSTDNGDSSDGGDDGSGGGSSSGNETGNSSSASSNDSGGNGSSSSGEGGSASSASGECDPTAKNYLECLNSKEINLPTEKGTFDGTGTDAEDRIGELEGELTDLVNQIKGEIQDVTGASVGGSGTLTDKCYQILKVEVCFGWARWSSLLSVIGTAIIAAAGVASFIIIMRQ